MTSRKLLTDAAWNESENFIVQKQGADIDKLIGENFPNSQFHNSSRIYSKKMKNQTTTRTMITECSGEQDQQNELNWV